MSTTAPTLTLTNPTNAQIDAAVAEHVAGWTNHGRAKGVPALEHRWKHPDPTLPFVVNTEHLPPFSTSADAVLPLLEKIWAYTSCFETLSDKAHYRVVLWLNSSSPNAGETSTFPLAACIALLRAHNIEVTFK